MEDQALVSVIVATHNMGKYIPEALESVLSQKGYSSFEIIVIDDGSTDNTGQMLSGYLKDNRVRYFSQNNQGPYRARNKGIAESRGDFIAFLDADDRWTQDKLAKQMPCFNIAQKIGVVYTNFAPMEEDGTIMDSPKRKRYSGNITGKLLISNFVTGMASIIRKQCLANVGNFNPTLTMGGDYDLWLRLSAWYDFYFLDEVTYLYRQWPGQASHNHRLRYESAIKIMTNFLAEHPTLVDPQVVKEAWAHTYVGRADQIFTKEKLKKEPFLDYLKALKYKPTYVPAWKSIIKLLINRY